MDIDTSFVSEFKYALYGYDAYFNASSDKEAAKTRLSIPEKAESVIGTYNFGIPLSEVLNLNNTLMLLKIRTMFLLKEQQIRIIQEISYLVIT